MISSGSAVQSASLLPAPRSHWTQAALLVVQTARSDSRIEGNEKDTTEAQIDATSLAPSPPQIAPLATASTGLFVPLSGPQRP